MSILKRLTDIELEISTLEDIANIDAILRVVRRLDRSLSAQRKRRAPTHLKPSGDYMTIPEILEEKLVDVCSTTLAKYARMGLYETAILVDKPPCGKAWLIKRSDVLSTAYNASTAHILPRVKLID